MGVEGWVLGFQEISFDSKTIFKQTASVSVQLLNYKASEVKIQYSTL